ncbi:MAG: bacillithiol biosynthesis deacetylase BshB1 [Planctomycetes bacterium]|jgi:bacillithiol biosynthesis deacetylase BshB1|nr:bacillithiol biosynthesis deacetylase BshB1 [Planctomycetota bacterium]
MDMDVLVFAAHPDDAELAAGGLLARCAEAGLRAAIVDFTRGEAGTRGTPEIRAAEAAAADRVLSIACRENLGFPDSRLTETIEARLLAIEALRKHRPALVAAPYVDDLHPDHAVVGRIVSAAIYPSGFHRIVTGSPPHRPRALVHYMNHTAFPPTFVLDVTSVWAKRMEAVRCYRSQFHDPDSKEPATNISAPDFLEKLAARFRHYGSLIGADYGEPYFSRGPVPVLDPLAICGRRS